MRGSSRGEKDAPFVISGGYLRARLVDERFERDGSSMRFHYWCYPLEEYARASEAAGLLIEILREPAVPDEAVKENGTEPRWQRLPNVLLFRLVKPLGSRLEAARR